MFDSSEINGNPPRVVTYSIFGDFIDAVFTGIHNFPSDAPTSNLWRCPLVDRSFVFGLKSSLN